MDWYKHACYGTCSLFFFILLYPPLAADSMCLCFPYPKMTLSYPSFQFVPSFLLLLFSSALTVYSLELGLGSLESGGEEVAEVVGGLVEVVAHPVGAEALGDDVEVEAV